MNIGAGIQTVTTLSAPYPYTSITYYHCANLGPCYHVHCQTNHEMYQTDKQNKLRQEQFSQTKIFRRSYCC